MVVVEKLPEGGGGKEPEANGNPAETGGGGTSGKAKSRKEKKDAVRQRDKKKAKKESAVKLLTKVVIRRLPPSMDEETFRKQIDPIPDHDEFYFVSGDWSLGKNASSRAYINFTRAADIFLFKDKFDGYDFVDAKGVEYPAVVEFAPFQELPRNRSRKKDAKCGTIETDTHFVAFTEALEAEEKDAAGKSKSKLEYSYKIKDEKKITSTPLLEFIAQKKQEKRDEKRRKLEEKKKQRKEERQKKAQGVGKGIPEVIKEEKIAGDDEIVVRTVPSRLDPAQGKKEGGGGKEKEKRQRNRKDRDKEKDRPKPEKEEVAGAPVAEPEKQLSRKQERDRMRKEKEKARKQEEREKKAAGEVVRIKERKEEKEKEPAPKVEAPKPTPADEAPPKKEVKKYSELRRETRARAETRLAELEERKDDEASASITSDLLKSNPNIPKIDIKKSVLTPHVAPFIPKEQKSSTIIVGPDSGSLPPAFPQKPITPTPQERPEDRPGAAPETPPAEDSSSCEKKHEIDGKLKEAREARKIRNKNRPSIEIYQPRKRIVSGGGASKEGRSEKSDSDRSSEQSARPGTSDTKTAAAAVKAKDNKRHKLTKKASDKERPRDRRSRRKNSSDAEMVEEPPLAAAAPAASVTEVVEALEGASLE
uniref:UPF3 domain-containing protein n=1 Tax=Culex tarsalis TaxID=7177 RepID=A0A1Q3FE14_CULTA